MTRATIGKTKKACQEIYALQQGLARNVDVGSHIGAPRLRVHTARVRPTVFRIVVASIALIVGVTAGLVHRPARPTRTQSGIAAMPAATPETAPANQATIEEMNYPDELGTNPYHIA